MTAAADIEKDVDYGSVIPTNNNLFRRRSSLEVSQTFLETFKSAKGAKVIVLLGFLTALGIGGIVGVIPKVTTQRFAEVNFDLAEGIQCDDYASTPEDKPWACVRGAEYAQTAASYAVLVSNLLALVTNSVAGSYSDTKGRRKIQILALLLMIGSPISFLFIQLWSGIHPLWYYVWECISRILSPFPIAFTQLSDVLPPKHRAPAFGVFFGSFMAGIAIAPFLATLMSHVAISFFSSVARTSALIIAFFCLPETLSTERRIEAAERQEQQQENDQETSLFDTVMQPLRKLEILRRSSSLLLLAFGAFTSKMVFSADATLFFYYVESSLGATEHDVAGMMFMAGIMGMLVQIGLLKYLISLLGERKLLITSFASGMFHNLVYGLAPSKDLMYIGLAFSALTNTNNALLSSLASRMVLTTEQGQIQGALFGLGSLAEAIGPVIFDFVHRNWHTFGPGTMFVMGAMLYGLGMIAVSLLPPRSSSSSTTEDDEEEENNNYGEETTDDEQQILIP